MGEETFDFERFKIILTNIGERPVFDRDLVDLCQFDRVQKRVQYLESLFGSLQLILLNLVVEPDEHVELLVFLVFVEIVAAVADVEFLAVGAHHPGLFAYLLETDVAAHLVEGFQGLFEVEGGSQGLGHLQHGLLFRDQREGFFDVDETVCRTFLTVFVVALFVRARVQVRAVQAFETRPF